MGRIDLHLHSTASDGKYTPAEVVRKAAALGLTAMALTDHDTVAGIPEALEAAKNYPGLLVIPGVEINTDVPGGEVHILGYFVDAANHELRASLDESRDSREKRARNMAEKLDSLGVHIKFSRIKELAGDATIGRPHVAQALLEKGYIGTIREAFDRYIGQGGPAYVEREKKTPVEAVRVIISAGGLPVMAHPFTATEPEKMMVTLKDAGLVGIEAYYGSYRASETGALLRLAAEHDLIPTGGSDYHGLDDNAETPMGNVPVPQESIDRLLDLVAARRRR